MYSPGDDLRDPLDRRILRLELIRLRYLGYLSYPKLLLVGIASFVSLTFLIAVSALTAFFNAFLLVLTVFAIVYGFIGLYIMRKNTVTVTFENGWYIAQDEEFGLMRHGATAEEALENLSKEIDLLIEHGGPPQ